MKLSDPIVFVDSHGVARGAILCTIWGADGHTVDETHPRLVTYTRDSKNNVIETDDPAPTVNLAFTSGDPDRTDNAGYGRQIERGSSVVHMSRQTVFGNYWRRLDETPKASEQ